MKIMYNIFYKFICKFAISYIEEFTTYYAGSFIIFLYSYIQMTFGNTPGIESYEKEWFVCLHLKYPGLVELYYEMQYDIINRARLKF